MVSRHETIKKNLFFKFFKVFLNKNFQGILIKKGKAFIAENIYLNIIQLLKIYFLNPYKLIMFSLIKIKPIFQLKQPLRKTRKITLMPYLISDKKGKGVVIKWMQKIKELNLLNTMTNLKTQNFILNDYKLTLKENKIFFSTYKISKEITLIWKNKGESFEQSQKLIKEIFKNRHNLHYRW